MKSAKAVVLCWLLSLASPDAMRAAAQPGQRLWQFRTAGWTESGPALGDNGSVYWGAYDGKVYAFDAATGAKQWEFATLGEVHSSPAVGDDGTVYIGSFDGRVYALHGSDGTLRWQFQTANLVYSTPAVSADGIVYVGSYDGGLYALEAGTGARLWAFATGGVIRSSPALGSDGAVYFGSHDRRVYAVDARSGAKRWESLTADRVWSSPALGPDGTVYAVSEDTRLYALEGATGALRWTSDRVIWDYTSSPAVAAAGAIYCSRFMFDQQTGNRISDQFAAGASPALAADGLVYSGNAAYDGLSGAKQWEFLTAQWSRPPPLVGPDGTVYVTAHEGINHGGAWEYYTWIWALNGKAPLADGPWPVRGHDARHTGRARNGAGPVHIVEQPRSQRVEAGQRAVLAVYCEGAFPRVYQWELGGRALAAATNSALSLDALPVSQNRYRVVVSNAFGTALSQEALLWVAPAGAPWVKADGQTVIRSVSRTDRTSISLETSFPNGTIFYTTDGSQPSFAATEYVGPFLLTNTTLLRALAYSADFAQTAEDLPVTILIGPGSDLATAVVGQGSIRLEPPRGPYPQGSQVAATATPAAGWRLARWEGDAGGAAPTVFLTMDANRSLRAVFEPIPQYRLDLLIAGQGTVEGIGAGPYYDGAVLHLRAVPAADWRFVRWEGALTGTELTTTLTMTRDQRVSAVFEVFPRYALTVIVAGGGTVVGNSAADYLEGAVVGLTALPAAGWQFIGWQGDSTATTPVLAVPMGGPKSVEARFGTVVSTTTSGPGRADLAPALPLYPYGASVLVVGVPEPGYYLARWGNAARGAFNPLGFVVTNASPTISALFAPVPLGQFLVSVTVAGPGLVTALPARNLFAPGETVTLTAQSLPGQVFAGWTGDVSDRSVELQLAVTANRNLTATFWPGTPAQLDPTSSRISPGGFVVVFTGVAGFSYEVQTSENLRTWRPLLTTVAAAGQTEVTDATALGRSARFYRLRAAP